MAELVGVSLVLSDADISIVDDQEQDWLLVVIDAEGERHEIRMPAAQDEAGREEIVWMGRSLLTPITAELPPAPTPVLAVQTPAPVLPPSPAAQPEPAGPLGVGVVVGSPVGVTSKLLLSSDRAHAVDLSAGSPDLGWRWTAHAGYLWAPRVASLRGVELFAHVGLGGVAEIERRSGYATVENRPRAGARLPLGVDLWVPSARIEAFAELASTALAGYRSELGLSGALGARYYFSRTR